MTAVEVLGLVHAPSRPGWQCQVDGADWPCGDARVELQELFGEDDLALAVFLVEHLFAASKDLYGTAKCQPRPLAERFVFWAAEPTTTERWLNAYQTVPKAAARRSASRLPHTKRQSLCSDPQEGHLMPYGSSIPNSVGAETNGSHWDVREETDAVYVRNSRVPLGPELRFTHDEWTDLLRVVASGGLPAYAETLGLGHAIKIALPDREADALFFWIDEMGAFTKDVRNGKYGPVPSIELRP